MRRGEKKAGMGEEWGRKGTGGDESSGDEQLGQEMGRKTTGVVGSNGHGPCWMLSPPNP